HRILGPLSQFTFAISHHRMQISARRNEFSNFWNALSEPSCYDSHVNARPMVARTSPPSPRVVAELGPPSSFVFAWTKGLAASHRRSFFWGVEKVAALILGKISWTLPPLEGDRWITTAISPLH